MIIFRDFWCTTTMRDVHVKRDHSLPFCLIMANCPDPRSPPQTLSFFPERNYGSRLHLTKLNSKPCLADHLFIFSVDEVLASVNWQQVSSLCQVVQGWMHALVRATCSYLVGRSCRNTLWGGGWPGWLKIGMPWADCPSATWVEDVL